MTTTKPKAASPGEKLFNHIMRQAPKPKAAHVWVIEIKEGSKEWRPYEPYLTSTCARARYMKLKEIEYPSGFRWKKYTRQSP